MNPSDFTYPELLLVRWLLQCLRLMSGIPAGETYGDWPALANSALSKIDSLPGSVALTLRMPHEGWNPDRGPLSLFAHEQVKQALHDANVHREAQDKALRSPEWICRGCESDGLCGVYLPRQYKHCPECGRKRTKNNE